MKFVAADYVGMELYLAAAVSGCQNLYDVFLTKEKDPDDPNGDMHVVTASSILKITPDQWQTMLTLNDTTNKKAKHYRQLAKTVNYLALYGGSPEGLQSTFLSQGLEYTVEECQEFLNAFFARFPEIKTWFSEMKYEIAKNGRLINNYGRIRHVLKRGGEVLSAINMLIQGLGAQIIKESLVSMSEDWKDINRFPLLVIHDENVIEVSEDDLVSTAKSMLVHMEITVKDKLDVKLLVDVLAGLSSLSKADKGVKLNYGS
jgi:DNA polymerase-1